MKLNKLGKDIFIILGTLTAAGSTAFIIQSILPEQTILAVIGFIIISIGIPIYIWYKTNQNQNTKRPSYDKKWFYILVTLFAIGIIFQLLENL